MAHWTYRRFSILVSPRTLIGSVRGDVLYRPPKVREGDLLEAIG